MKITRDLTLIFSIFVDKAEIGSNTVGFGIMLYSYITKRLKACQNLSNLVATLMFSSKLRSCFPGR